MARASQESVKVAQSGHAEAVSVAAPSMTKALVAEILGTCVLVVGGVGTAVLATGGPMGNKTAGWQTVVNGSVGWLGVALAFGLTVVVGAYAFGPISGGHFNPAVTVGLWAAGRFPASKVGPYVIAQIVGGAIGSTLVYLMCLFGPKDANGKTYAATASANGFASNGFGAHSPGGFGLGAAIICEVLVTFIFVAVICGATSKIANAGMAGLAIGLTLALMHLVAIPVTNASINPARSIAAAIYGGGAAWAQIWVFLIFPTVGGALAGLLFRTVLKDGK